jgi:NTE family protein
MQAIRTLILSGGGGRGAFHAGVYKYLLEQNKEGVAISHQDVWEPEIVVGTSIGAVNGAAIVQGISPRRLENIWLRLREDDIQGLPPGMRGFSRWVTNQILRRIIGVPLPQIPPEWATSPEPGRYWPPLPLMPRWLAERLIGRWINLLDTGPLLQTMVEEFKIDPDKLAQRDETLLIAATDVQSGERVIFSNHEVIGRDTGQPRPDVETGISLNRILASCSIPLVYPWTYDPGTDAVYWDGAVVANTPLGAALDVVRDQPVEIPMEVVVVLMTPWWDPDDETSSRSRRLPESFDEAITWTLDWALLASFRERLRLIEAYNRLARRERAEGHTPLRYREVNIAIVAPEDFFSAARILDYDDYSRELIDQGYQSAQRAFQRYFASV